MDTIQKYLGLLWSHRIIRVGLAYLAAGWATFQVAMNVMQALALPDWVAKFTLVMVALGFPLALVLAWAWGERAPKTEKPVTVGPTDEANSELVCIAVLPLANFSRKPSDEVFADGIVEDLITNLSMNPALRVVSRSSTFAYKGQSPDIREVAADLGAAFVLEGSVRRVGERLRLTAQLIEAKTGGHIWAEQFDRPLAELFDLQDDLVCDIASALGAEIDRMDLRRARSNSTSVTAWQEAQRSAYLYERPSLTELPIAIAHARKSVQLDPNYGLGRVRLALALATGAQMKGEGTGGPYGVEAAEHARQAVALAPRHPKVLGMACSVLANVGFPEEGLRHGLRSLELNPNDATVYGSVGNALFRGGRPAEAFPYYDAEERLAPRSLWLNGRLLYRGLAYLALSRPDDAAKAFKRSIAGDPAFEQAWAALAATEAVRGDMAAAVAAVDRLRELNPKAPMDLWLAALTGNISGPLASAAAEGFLRAWTASANQVADIGAKSTA